MSIRDDMLRELETRAPLTEEATFLGQPCVLYGLTADQATKLAVLADQITTGNAPRRGLEHPVIYALVKGLRDEDGERIFKGAADADKLLSKGYLGEMSSLANRIGDLSGIEDDEDTAKNLSGSD